MLTPFINYVGQECDCDKFGPREANVHRIHRAQGAQTCLEDACRYNPAHVNDSGMAMGDHDRTKLDCAIDMCISPTLKIYPSIFTL